MAVRLSSRPSAYAHSTGDFLLSQDTPRGCLDGSLLRMARDLNAMTIEDSDDCRDISLEKGYSFTPKQSAYGHGSPSGGYSGASTSGALKRSASGSGDDYSESNGSSDGSEPPSERGHQGGDGGDGEGEGAGASPGSLDDEVGSLACPFRKNPTTMKQFTFRNRKECIKPFREFNALKRHVRDHHYDDKSMEDLRSRKDKGKVSTWEQMWMTLWPDWNDEIPPQQYQPCFALERSEVRNIVLDPLARQLNIPQGVLDDFLRGIQWENYRVPVPRKASSTASEGGKPKKQQKTQLQSTPPPSKPQPLLPKLPGGVSHEALTPQNPVMPMGGDFNPDPFAQQQGLGPNQQNFHGNPGWSQY